MEGGSEVGELIEVCSTIFDVRYICFGKIERIGKC